VADESPLVQMSGMEIALRALPHDVVAAGYALLQEARDHKSEPAGAALGVLVDALHHQRDRAAQALADKVRVERDAMARAQDCTEHGQMIKQAQQDTQRWADLAERNSRARMVLLDGNTSLSGFVRLQRATIQEPWSPTARAMLDNLDSLLQRIDRAYMRAWST
jgi:hypothetical protein